MVTTNYESRLRSIANADWENNYVTKKGKVREKNLFCQFAKEFFHSMCPIKPLVHLFKPFIKPFVKPFKPFIKPVVKPFVKTAKNILGSNDSNLRKSSKNITRTIESFAHTPSNLSNDQKVDLAFQAATSFNNLLTQVEKKKGLKKGSYSNLKISDKTITKAFKHLFPEPQTEKRKEQPEKKKMFNEPIKKQSPIQTEEQRRKDEETIKKFAESFRQQKETEKGKESEPNNQNQTQNKEQKNTNLDSID